MTYYRVSRSDILTNIEVCILVSNAFCHVGLFILSYFVILSYLLRHNMIKGPGDDVGMLGLKEQTLADSSLFDVYT